VFTGIVEEVGKLASKAGDQRASRLVIAASRVLEDVQLGDSIAVNGVCLTVTSFNSRQFTADVMPETMQTTTLGSLRPGELLNLERAMAAGDRFAGHLVSGHVDGVGRIIARRPDANAVRYDIQAPEKLLKTMIHRGSIAVDGISLTIAGLGESFFTVSVIPHTMRHTNLLQRRMGDQVNLECDMIGKYVERLLGYDRGEERRFGADGLSLERLRAYGFE